MTDQDFQIYIAPELRDVPFDQHRVVRHNDDTDETYASRCELFRLIWQHAGLLDK